MIYGIIGQPGAHIGLLPHEVTEQHVVMDSILLTGDAIAQADGTWFEPNKPDITIDEVENIVAMFPVSYEYVFKQLGFDDITS